MNPLQQLATPAGGRRLYMVENQADEALITKHGLRATKIVTQSEAMMIADGSGYELDQQYDSFDEFVLCFRSENLRDAVATNLDDTRCRWINWETVDIKDVYGSSRPMWIDEVCRLEDIPDVGPQEAFRTGFKMLDDHGFRLVRNAFMPVIGPYGSGKSVLLRQLAVNLWKLHGWRTLVTAFEESVKPRYVRDLRQHLVSWNGDHSVHDTAALDREINTSFCFLRRKKHTPMCADRLCDRIDYACRVYGVDMVIIDPVNEVDHIVPKGESKTDYMGRFIMKLKHLADDHNLLMICAAHPPKDAAGRRASNHIYTLNDGADTAHYGNKADIGWTVWRPDGRGATYLNIDKCKDVAVMGKPTVAKLSFNSQLERFTVTGLGSTVVAEINGEDPEDAGF